RRFITRIGTRPATPVLYKTSRNELCILPASANAPGTSLERNLEERYPLPSTGCDSMTGQAALHRFVRPVSVPEFPDSVYFSRLLPKGVNKTQMKKMTVKTRLTAKACAGLRNNTKNIINETKLATMPPLVPANIITTMANKAHNRNPGFFVSQRNIR